MTRVARASILCIVTTHYRLWIFSSTGQILVTASFHDRPITGQHTKPMKRKK